MPTYEYECTGCGQRVDVFQRMTDPLLTRCPQCGATEGLRRLIGAGAGIIFRGSGFYETDYKRNGGRAKKPDAAPGATNEPPSAATTAAAAGDAKEKVGAAKEAGAGAT